MPYFSLAHLIDLLILSVPITTAYVHARRLLLSLRRKEGIASYAFSGIIALVAFLFALWLYVRRVG